MNLAKIIGELRLELQCLNTAIASMEELARVQSLSESTGREFAQPDATPPPSGDEPPPAKRRRGRPPKNVSQASEESPQPVAPASAPAGDEPTASAA
jgi:hypothetical protein